MESQIEAVPAKIKQAFRDQRIQLERVIHTETLLFMSSTLAMASSIATILLLLKLVSISHQHCVGR